MLKKILIFTPLALLAIGIIWSWNRYSTNPKAIIPLPYQFSSMRPRISPLQAPILIIGDRMGERFAKYIPQLQETMSSGLSRPIEIESWAREHEGIHRTIEKLKSLEKLPKVIIYMGGSEEWNEEKYDPSQVEVYLKNLKHYENDKIQTALMLAPWLAPFLYEKYLPVTLSSDLRIPTPKKTIEQQLQENELRFLLYEIEVSELLRFIKSRGSLPILVTTPLNLDIAPKENCPGSLNEGFEATILDGKEALMKGDFKSAFSLLNGVKSAIPTHADVYYYLGQASKNLGLWDEARDNLTKSMAYDCQLWRGSPINNVIIRKHARLNQSQIFDFEQMLIQEWETNIVFDGEIYPQNLYFEKLANALGKVLKKILKI